MQMKGSVIIALLILHILVAGCSRTTHFGNYYNKWRYWGPMFTLKSDSTFDYVMRADAGTVTEQKQNEFGRYSLTTDSYIFYDSSFGTYKVIKDTVFLSYATMEVEGDFNGFNFRPAKLYWKGKSLFYIDSIAGFVIRQKEYYMTWSRHRIVNLSRIDQENVQKIR